MLLLAIKVDSTCMFVEQIGHTALVNPSRMSISCGIWYVNDLQIGRHL
jgi:hypothetical protein